MVILPCNLFTIVNTSRHCNEYLSIGTMFNPISVKAISLVQPYYVSTLVPSLVPNQQNKVNP